MTYAVIITVFIATLAAALYAWRRIGASEVEQDVANQRAEASDEQAQGWADRPRTDSDLADRLRREAASRRS